MLYDFYLPDNMPLTCHSSFIRWQNNGKLFWILPLCHVDIKSFITFKGGKLNLSLREISQEMISVTTEWFNVNRRLVRQLADQRS
jgi:hypothetical protein